MITFKAFLLEKAQNRTAFKAAYAKLDGLARIGFEVEFRVGPENKFFTKENSKDIKIESIRWYDSMKEFDDAFEISIKRSKGISLDYEAWVSAQVSEYVDEHYQEHMSDEDVEEYGARTAERNARAAAAKSVKSSDFTWTQWFKAEFSGPYSFAENYDLHPKFGWAVEGAGDRSQVNIEQAVDHSELNWDDTAAVIAPALGAALSVKIKIAKIGTDYSSWKIVPDTSITDGVHHSDTMTGVGMEIVTPPLELQDAMEKLKLVFDFITSNDLDTNATTSVHVNISIPDLKTKLDPLKLVMFMGDEHVLKQFDRLDNTYTLPQIKAIIDGIQISGTVPKSGEELIKQATESLHTGKYRSVNFGHLIDSGYLEFRSAGGADYHKKFDLIAETIGRWLAVIDLACNPADQRNEYIKKVSKLLGRTDQAEQAEPDLDFEELVNILPVRALSPKRILAALNAGAEDPIKLSTELVGELGGVRTKPTFKQIKQAREFFKKINVTMDQIRSSATRLGLPYERAADRGIIKFKLS